jgi:hypothetical protein
MQRAVLLLSAFSLAYLMAIFVSACGIGIASQVSVAIAPTQATVAAGSSVDFRGDATGPSKTAFLPDWWVQESYDLHPNKDCGFFAAKDASFANCPFGYVVIGSDYPQMPSHAAYFAPPTPGTYHVTFEAWWGAEAFVTTSKTASATVTVTP